LDSVVAADRSRAEARASHATSSPGGISANWIYYVDETIRGLFGPEPLVVFLQGPSGDLTQVAGVGPPEALHEALTKKAVTHRFGLGQLLFKCGGGYGKGGAVGHGRIFRHLTP
jgi:hypothetical protein